MLKSEVIQAKILQDEDLMRQLAVWRFKDHKIVFTNGCFDILHPGHIDYLMKAADLGNRIIVGLNSDNSVRRLKGESRPLIGEKERALTLASLSFVNAVVIFDEDTPYELIKSIQPDILVKGKDYEISDIAGHDIVLNNGGQVITLELLPGYSTTSLIEKLRT